MGEWPRDQMMRTLRKTFLESVLRGCEWTECATGERAKDDG